MLTYKGAERGRWRELQILPCQGLTGAISPSRAGLCKPWGAHGYPETGRNPNSGFRVGDTAWSLPGQPQESLNPPVLGYTRCDEPGLEHLLSCYLGKQGTLQETNQCILGPHWTHYGMLRGETKGDERERFKWFGEEWEWGKQERIKGLVANVLFWPWPAPHQSVFVLKSFLTLILDEGFSIWYEEVECGRVWTVVSSWVRLALCLCASHWRYQSDWKPVPAPEQDHGPQRCVCPWCQWLDWALGVQINVCANKCVCISPRRAWPDRELLKCLGICGCLCEWHHGGMGYRESPSWGHPPVCHQVISVLLTASCRLLLGAWCFFFTRIWIRYAEKQGFVQSEDGSAG